MSLKDFKTGLRSEWLARTTYGKIWYPIWLLVTGLQIGLLAAFFAGAGVMKHVWESDSQHEPLMEVYKHDE